MMQFKEGKELPSYGLVGIMAIKQRTLQKVKLKLKKGYVRILLGDTKGILYTFFLSEDRIQRGFLNDVQIFHRNIYPVIFFESSVLKIP